MIWDEVSKLIDISTIEITRNATLAHDLALVSRELKQAGQIGLAEVIALNGRQLHINALDLSGRRAAARHKLRKRSA